MKYAKDSVTNAPYQFDDNVVALKQLDGAFRFETQTTVHVPDLVVRRAAVVTHEALFDEVVSEAQDEVLIPAHDEVRAVTVLNTPATLVPITQAEFDQLEADIAAEIAAARAALPNQQGFIDDFKTAVGGVIAAQTVFATANLLLPAMTAANWSEVDALIVDAHTKEVIDDAQYLAVKNAATANNIPLTLP